MEELQVGGDSINRELHREIVEGRRCSGEERWRIFWWGLICQNTTIPVRFLRSVEELQVVVNSPYRDRLREIVEVR